MRLNQFMLTVVSPTARLRPNQFLPLPAAATLGGRLVATLMLFAADLAASEPPRAAVFRKPSPGHDETLARIIANQVSAAGYAVSFINTASLTNTSPYPRNSLTCWSCQGPGLCRQWHLRLKVSCKRG